MRTSIPFADVAQFIESLDVDLTDVREVLITRDAVTVTENRRDEQGHYFGAGDVPASVTTDIRIERGA
ncbi:hypothetical protein [Streptomyces sp. DW26H14]|uniref:hypothetical protein n=1 Tax=Streptomyces sp. DW26H14 TaxID=3435395 RepID=UPI00403E1B1E